MATAQITIVDGKFTDYNGRYLEFIHGDTLAGNGWECWFEPNGALRCESSRQYLDGWHTMTYQICPNGFATQTLHVDGKKPKVIKKGYVVPKGQKFKSGLLGLSGGYVDSRYAYFRHEGIQKFLDTYGITAISRENPNKVYDVRSAFYGGGESTFAFWTDGKKKRIEIDNGRTEQWREENPETSAREHDVKIYVANASWVVVDQSIHEGDRNCHSRILYTKAKDPTTLDLTDVLTKDMS